MNVNRFLLVAGVIGLGCTGIAASSVQQKQHSPFYLPPQRAGAQPGGANLIPGAALGWKPSSQTAEALAAQTDKALSWASGWGSLTSTNFKDGFLNGRSRCKSEIESPTKFHIEYPTATTETVSGNGTRKGYTRVTALADGRRLGFVSVAYGFRDVQPVASAKLADSCPIGEWVREYPKFILSPVRGGKPFEKLVALARKVGAGLKVSVDERSFEYRGQILHQRRLTVERKKGYGTPLHIQIVIDASLYFPVTIEAKSGSTKKDQVLTSWSGSWGRSKSGKFPPDDFVLPQVARK
jgi:hypothetical protein